MKRERILPRLARCPRGAAAVEFALLATVFLMALCAILELGRFAWMEHSVERAARTGLRYAMVRGAASTAPATTASITARVRETAAGMGLTPAAVTLAADPYPGGNEAGRTVVIAVSYPFRPLVPWPLVGETAIAHRLEATILN